MNILFYEYGLNPFTGGVQRVSYNIAKQLKGEHSTYVCYTTNEEYKSAYNEAFTGHINIKDLSSASHKSLLEFIKSNRISVIINQCGCELEHTSFLYGVKQEYDFKLYSFVHTSPTGSRDVLGYRDFNFPKLVFRSIVKEFVFLFYKADSKRFREIYRISDKVILLSKYHVDEFKHIIHSKDEASKIMAIPNMVPFPPQNENIIVCKRKKILVVARMGETVKRLSRVLYAWNHLHKDLTDWDLTFVGDGSELPKFKELARKMNLPRLTFTGSTNSQKYYEDASIFLMTSASEGFPMTILEAMQFGVVPIVMDSCKSFHEMIDNGKNGFLTPNKSLSVFETQIMELANDNVKRQQMASNAMKSTSAFYPEAIINLWKQLLKA